MASSPLSSPRPVGRNIHPAKFASLPEFGSAGVVDKTYARPFNWHVHPGKMEICYIDRGRLNWQVGTERYDLRGGDVYITWPDEPHGGFEDTMHPGRLYWIVFTPVEPGDKNWLSLPPDEGQAIRNGLASLQKRSFQSKVDLSPFYRTILNASEEEGNPLTVTTIRSTLVSLLTMVIEQGRQERIPDRVSPQVGRALRVMNENLTEPLSLEEIAETVGWSVSHFKARFRKEIAETPAKLYLGMRVQAVLDSLRRQPENLAALAARFGFSSSQYLATCVKRITGRSPSEFRNGTVKD